MVLLSSLVLIATAGRQAATGKLVGATVQVNAQPAVRLRWSMADGALPSGGFNVYRTDPSGTTKLNPAPIDAAPEGKRDPTYVLAAKAMRIAGVQSQLISGKVTRQSSASAFAAMRSGIKTLTGVAGTPPTALQIRSAMNKSPEVGALFKSLTPGAKFKGKRVYSDAEKVANARTFVILQAMLHPEAASKLGLGFDDTKVTANASYTYTLKAVEGGAETQVATFQITVGKDPQPPTPTVEEPVQTGEHSISLHMEVPPNVDETDFGVLSFNVVRIDSAHPSGVPVSKDPIMPSYQTTLAGTQVATLTTFMDSGASFGNVTYQVKLVDSFGRLSPTPASVSTVMKDIAAPAPVTGAVATYSMTRPANKQSVTVTYTASQGDSTAPLPNNEVVKYKVQRLDIDRVGADWVDINPSNFSFTAANVAAMPMKTLAGLYPAARTAATNSAVRVAKQSSLKGVVRSKFLEVERLTVAQFQTKYVGELAGVEAMKPGELVDNSVEPDHYYRYRIIPLLVRSGVAGDAAQTAAVGVPALAQVPAPTNLAIADAIAPQVLTFKGSVTNVYKLQPTHGVFLPGSSVATAPSVQFGASMASKVIGRRPVTKPGNLKGRGSERPIAANYGRMETITWTAPTYTSPVYYKVYRANGTGYVSNVNALSAPAQLANASAEQAGGRVIQKPNIGGVKPELSGIKQGIGRPVLTGRGVYRPLPGGLQFAMDTPPPLSAYTLLGTTKPGETQFIDLVTRSQSNVFYYYVVPVNRWGTPGQPITPTKVKTLPSLPPSVPAFLSAYPNEKGIVAAGVQPNMMPEDVVEYRLFRMTVKTPVNVVAAKGLVSTTLSQGKLGAEILGKASEASATRAIGGRSLVAKGVPGGGAKFGIYRTESPFSVVAAYQGLSSTAGRSKQPQPPMMSEVNQFLDFSKYTQVATLTADPTNLKPVYILDPSGVAGDEYVYRVVAVDSAGLVSEPSTLLDASPIKTTCDPPKSVTAVYVPATNSVTFTLGQPLTGCQAFVIERAIDANASKPVTSTTKFLQLKIVGNKGADSVTFSDTAVRPGQTYFYRVSCIDAFGNSSITETIETHLPSGFIDVQVKT